MTIEVRQPKFSRYAEANFECENGHTTKRWCWSDCYEVACATCEQPASRLLPRRLRLAQGVQPMQYAVNPATGELWVPGRAGKRPPRGYVPREVRTWRERDLFYKEQRERIERDHQEFALGHEYEFGSLIDDGHSRLRDYLANGCVPEIDRATNQPTGRMERLSEEGRDLIRLALSKEGYTPPAWGGAEVHIDSWENDRPSHCGDDTNWRDQQA